jgi:hypothetical protein
LLRKERLRDNMTQVDSVMIASVDKEPIQVGPNMMDQILKIAESHKK